MFVRSRSPLPRTLVVYAGRALPNARVDAVCAEGAGGAGGVGGTSSAGTSGARRERKRGRDEGSAEDGVDGVLSLAAPPPPPPQQQQLQGQLPPVPLAAPRGGPGAPPVTTVLSTLHGPHSVGEGGLGYLTTADARALRLVNVEFRDAVALVPWADAATVATRNLGGWRASFPRARAIRLAPDGLRGADYAHLLGVHVIGEGGDAALTLPALHVAAKMGSADGVRSLLALGAAADATDGRGRTPLHWAAQNGNAAVADALLSAASAHACTAKGSTPLHWAAWHGHAVIVRLLLAHGAAGAAVNDAGWTPLHVAAYLGYPHVIVALLDGSPAAAAAINARTADGRSAMDLARHLPTSGAQEALRRAGGE